MSFFVPILQYTVSRVFHSTRHAFEGPADFVGKEGGEDCGVYVRKKFFETLSFARRIDVRDLNLNAWIEAKANRSEKERKKLLLLLIGRNAKWRKECWCGDIATQLYTSVTKLQERSSCWGRKFVRYQKNSPGKRICLFEASPTIDLSLFVTRGKYTSLLLDRKKVTEAAWLMLSRFFFPEKKTEGLNVLAPAPVCGYPLLLGKSSVSVGLSERRRRRGTKF